MTSNLVAMASNLVAMVSWNEALCRRVLCASSVFFYLGAQRFSEADLNALRAFAAIFACASWLKAEMVAKSL